MQSQSRNFLLLANFKSAPFEAYFFTKAYHLEAKTSVSGKAECLFVIGEEKMYYVFWSDLL